MTTVKRQKGEGAKKLELIIAGIKNQQVKVGFMESAKYEDGTPAAYVAAIQEFGHGPIPPRPFMRPTIVREQKRWKEIADKAAKASFSTDVTLNLIGSDAAGGIKRSISDVTTPPLSPTTLRLRKLKREGKKITGATVGEAHRYANSDGADLSGVSTKPLVFDGILIGSVTHVVEDAK